MNESNGNSLTINHIFLEHLPAITTVINNYSGKPDEDLLSDAYEFVLTKLLPFYLATPPVSAKTSEVVPLQSYLNTNLFRFVQKYRRYAHPTEPIEDVPDEHQFPFGESEDIELILSTLDDLTRRVIELHLGLPDSEPQTFEQIGFRLHISKQAVQKTYAMGKKKLKKCI